MTRLDKIRGVSIRSHAPRLTGFTALMLLAGLSLCLDGFDPASPVVGTSAGLRGEALSSPVANILDFSRTFRSMVKAPKRSGAPDSQDARLYAEIFDLQEQGDIAAADAKIALLSDRSLFGHVLYQRYMHPVAYRTSFTELREWLDAYADHPGADKIYRLALARMPGDYKGSLKKPQAFSAVAEAPDPVDDAGQVYTSSRKRSPQEQARVQSGKNAIVTLVLDGKSSDALRTLREQESMFDATEYDILLGRIAAARLYGGQANEAFSLARQAVARSGRYVPVAAWTAGLAAWTQGQRAESEKYFGIAALSPYSSGWTAAAGGYWAARAAEAAGHSGAAQRWYSEAATHPRTFYGILATRAIGEDFSFNWNVADFTAQDRKVLARTSEGKRAMALVAARQPHRAESELAQADLSDGTIRKAVLAYAASENLAGLAMKLGADEAGRSGRYIDAALFPRLPWEPEDGYTVDPALVNAIARQESRFDPHAESTRGAVGLMQIMPRTASAFAASGIIGEDGKPVLREPKTNIEIGQRYIRSLMKDRNVRGDILRLLVAYNAGPGNLARWKKHWTDVSDPLLFVELIPSAQTRAYVERVLANYWIYRMRDGLPTPTLEALADGRAIMPPLEEFAQADGAVTQ